MTNTFLRRTSRGFALAEVMVMLAIVSITLTVSFAVVQQGTQFADSSENRIQAINFAREGIEIATNIRDTNYLKFSANYTNCWNTLNYSPTCTTWAPVIMSGAYSIEMGTGVTGGLGSWMLTAQTWAVTDMSQSGAYALFLTARGSAQWLAMSSPVCTRNNLITPITCRTIFRRRLFITPTAADQMIVTSQVAYFDTERSDQTVVTLEKTLTNWASDLR